MNRVLAAALTAALLIIAGCWGPSQPPLPDTIPELETVAVEARDTATAAPDAAAAAFAADRAEAAVAKAESLLGEAPADADAERVARARAAAVAARHAAKLAADREAVASHCSGIKHKAYFGARGAALTAVFEGLALAARQADEGGIESLPEDVRPAADLAGDLAERVAGRARLEDGSRDWKGIAEDMKAMRQDPPARLGLLLAAGYLITARDGLALYEIEAIDPAKITAEDERVGYHVLRGMICRLNGHPTLAQVELEEAMQLGESSKEGVLAFEQAQGLLHLMLAVYFASEKDYERADLEIVRAMKAWPDNPVAVFLTGEQLAADGKDEEAADSLEKWAAGTRSEELAKIVADRARELRDAKGPPEPLLSNGTVVRLLLVHLLDEAAEKSPAVKKVRDTARSGRAFVARITSHLPGGGD